MSRTLLAVDVGNTHTVLGFYEDQRLCATCRLSTGILRTADELFFSFKQCFQEITSSDCPVDGCIVASVVPVLDEAVKGALHRLTGADILMVATGLELGLTVGYDRPGDVGADRLANAVAAVHHYGAPVIVVDFGTAITFCLVDKSRTYLGGAIAPGIGLTAGTAKLHSVDLSVPVNVVGRSTGESIQSGLLYGFASLTDGMITRFKSELGTKAPVIATGGLASLIVPVCRNVTDVRADLTLDGLRLIYDMNT